jgi:hypothetical protein
MNATLLVVDMALILTWLKLTTVLTGVVLFVKNGLSMEVH